MTTEAERERLYEQMLAVEGGDIALRVERDPAEVEKRPGAVVSAEAFEMLMLQVRTWVGSRMMRRFNARGVGLANLEVTVGVRMDDEDPETTEVVRFNVIDGSHRRAS